jgi:hypothetical protein
MGWGTDDWYAGDSGEWAADRIAREDAAKGLPHFVLCAQAMDHARTGGECLLLAAEPGTWRRDWLPVQPCALSAEDVAWRVNAWLDRQDVAARVEAACHEPLFAEWLAEWITTGSFGERTSSVKRVRAEFRALLDNAALTPAPNAAAGNTMANAFANLVLSSR